MLKSYKWGITVICSVSSIGPTDFTTPGKNTTHMMKLYMC